MLRDVVAAERVEHDQIVAHAVRGGPLDEHPRIADMHRKPVAGGEVEELAGGGDNRGVDFDGVDPCFGEQVVQRGGQCASTETGDQAQLTGSGSIR